MVVAMVVSTTTCADYVMPLCMVLLLVCVCDCDCGGECLIFCYAGVFSHKLDRSPSSAANEDRARNSVCYGVA